VWFSCGATSAVAAKLAVQKYQGKRDVHVVYCDTGGEHKSNKIFLREVEKWVGCKVKRLRNKRYRDHFDVYRKEGYIIGPHGAKCTQVLKRRLRQAYEDVESDIQVFGFSVEEIERAENFRMRNLDVYLETILIDNGLSKMDCLAILQKEGIDLPFMYLTQRSGAPYGHNNCLPCVKGGAGYFNKIRIDFPKLFWKMARIEEFLNQTCVVYRGKRIFLKDLPKDAGRFEEEQSIECGLICEAALEDIRHSDS